MDKWIPQLIVIRFPQQNPYTGKIAFPTIAQECSLYELNEQLLDIMEDSHKPIESDLYLHYQWKLKQIGGES